MPARFSVEITKSAEQDLQKIWDFISQDSPRMARQFVSKLERQVLALESFPLRCPLISESELLGVPYRHLVIGKYRVIFRISDQKVYVLRIVHGAHLLETSILEKERSY